jgi:hypothetical protein
VIHHYADSAQAKSPHKRVCHRTFINILMAEGLSNTTAVVSSCVEGDRKMVTAMLCFSWLCLCIQAQQTAGVATQYGAFRLWIEP